MKFFLCFIAAIFSLDLIIKERLFYELYHEPIRTGYLQSKKNSKLSYNINLSCTFKNINKRSSKANNSGRVSSKSKISK